MLSEWPGWASKNAKIILIARVAAASAAAVYLSTEYWAQMAFEVPLPNRQPVTC